MFAATRAMGAVCLLSVSGGCGSAPLATIPVEKASAVSLGDATITVWRATKESGDRPTVVTACVRPTISLEEIPSPGQLWIRWSVRNTGPHVLDLKDTRFALLDSAGHASTPLTRDRILARFAERCPAWHPESVPLPELAPLPEDARVFPGSTWAGWLVFSDAETTAPAAVGLYAFPVEFDPVGAPLRTEGARIPIDVSVLD